MDFGSLGFYIFLKLIHFTKDYIFRVFYQIMLDVDLFTILIIIILTITLNVIIISYRLSLSNIDIICSRRLFKNALVILLLILLLIGNYLSSSFVSSPVSLYCCCYLYQFFYICIWMGMGNIFLYNVMRFLMSLLLLFTTFLFIYLMFTGYKVR